MTEQDREKLDRLILEAQTLGHEISQLAQESGTQIVSLAHTAKRNRMMIWSLGVSLALDVLITVVLAVTGIGMARNTERINNLTNRLDDSQTTQRQRALCPLYQLFLDSRSDEGRKAAPDPEKYDHAFDVIQKGYDVLDCASFHGNY